VGILREVSGMLLNIHGQNDNQQLLDPKNHVHILDSYAAIHGDVERYRECYRKMLHLRAEIDSASRDTMEQARMAEMLRFQIADIDAVKLKKGEEEALEETVLKLRNLEQISKSCALVEKALRGGKGMGAIYLTERAAAAMESISDAVTDAGDLAERLNNIRYELEDIASSLSDIADIGGDDPTAKLDRAEERLDTISKLKRKYGSTVEEILQFKEEAVRKLDFIENADGRIEELEDELKAITKEADDLAENISSKRRLAAKGLTKSVTETLTFLEMPKVRFEVSVKKADELNAFGKDTVEFLISANAGEPLMPMAKIASGGELARIMLSLKNVLNVCDGIDTVIFDEIDTGISGKTSRKVGIKLKEIGRSSQVICVTHSAQIASLADRHLFISKKETEGRTETEVRELDEQGRIGEIARILGGIEITDVQRRAAEEMIAEGKML
jgi:DNA repair protein RecN (Recombination protein N)